MWLGDDVHHLQFTFVFLLLSFLLPVCLGMGQNIVQSKFYDPAGSGLQARGEGGACGGRSHGDLVPSSSVSQ